MPRTHLTLPNSDFAIKALLQQLRSEQEQVNAKIRTYERIAAFGTDENSAPSIACPLPISIDKIRAQNRNFPKTKASSGNY